MTSFLDNVVKNNTKELDYKLRYKPVMLEGLHTEKPSKKPKRKEMSAREKKMQGIYNISSANQRLVEEECTVSKLIFINAQNFVQEKIREIMAFLFFICIDMPLYFLAKCVMTEVYVN